MCLPPGFPANCMAINHLVTSPCASVKTAVPGNPRHEVFPHVTVNLKPGRLEWLQKRTEQIWLAKGKLTRLLWVSSCLRASTHAHLFLPGAWEKLFFKGIAKMAACPGTREAWVHAWALPCAGFPTLWLYPNLLSSIKWEKIEKPPSSFRFTAGFFNFSRSDIVDYTTSFLGGGAVLCSVECSAASLAPTHYRPAPLTRVYADIASCYREGKTIPRWEPLAYWEE